MSEPPATALLIIAKAPVPGHSKTRLTPPCTPEQAAALAEAALVDTLAAVAAVPGERRRLLVLEGEPGDWVPDGFEVHPQRSGGLGDRLAGAFAAAGERAFLVGMDTPQLEAAHIQRGVVALEQDGVDAVLGRAPDGGYWAIGLRAPDERVFAEVPMSADDTGEVQRARMDGLGLGVAELEHLRDVDTIEDARAVAAERPGSRFARALSDFGLGEAAEGRWRGVGLRVG